MKNIIKNNYIALSGKKVLISAMAAAITTVMATGITQASDIDLYQSAKSGDITLMLMLDTSGSMGYPQLVGDKDACDIPAGTSVRANGSELSTSNPSYRRYYCTILGSNVRYYDRITRLKDGLFDLLNGNSTTNPPIARLANDKLIGLSTYSTSADGRTGRILVPARRLDAMVSGESQRTLLLRIIANLEAKGGTPTAHAYAETAAYLMGTTTYSPPTLNTLFQLIRVNRSNNSFFNCTAWSANGTCNSWNDGSYPNFVASDVAQAGLTVTSNTTYTFYSGVRTGDSGFVYSSAASKANGNYIKPSSLSSQLENTDKVGCSGQGIYVLTDGQPNGSSTQQATALMSRALGSKGATFTCNIPNGSGGLTGGSVNGGWECISNFNQKLLDPSSNPLGLKLKTAVVGFGNTFNGITSYNKSLSQEQNKANIEATTIQGTTNNAQTNAIFSRDIKNAAKWGVDGEGGWYSGSDSKDIVDSVNAFISSLATEIPPVSTGSPSIPNDALYPAQLQNFAYYPQFDPTPDKDFQLWAGNLKKYRVSSEGKLVDKFSSPIVETSGKIVDNYDLWSPEINTKVPIDADVNTIGSKNRALMGGMKSQLLLKFVEKTQTENRKLLTNRIGTSGSSIFTGGTTLRQVKASDISDSIYKNDPNRGYLVSLLGFNGLNVANPSSITSAVLSNAPELRQVGAVMHSSPLLLTNEGKITAQNNVLTTTDRKDFVLFGTTQGLLHVVDAVTGKEKFAFVPNEMVENQKEAFLNYDTTSGGINNMFYGIDAPWTSYTEYVVGNDKLLTVGSKTATSPTGVQMVYGGLRMGGSSYYALDLQNIEDPKLKFHIDPVNQKVYFNNSSKSFPQLSSMGQSWSKPQIAWIRWNGERKRVMLVGGGYDSGYESDKYNQTNAKGAGVYMFDAENGDLLWWSSKNAADTSSGVIGVNNNDLKYSVVSEIRSVDSDEDGLADNLYFGDLGGQLWRVDLDNKATSIANFATKPVRLLNLNSGVTSPRFYDMPAFSVYSHNGTKFAVISVGSGNRSQPLAEYTFDASNYSYDAVYNIYDKDVARADLLTTNTYKTKDITLTGVGALKEIDNTNRVIQTSSVAPYETSGWFYQFKSNKIQSAKVVGTPSVMNYRMYVSYFDASKPGLSGDCGAGVKGESFLSTFCMPFGQCDKSTSLDDLIRDVPLGAGLQTTTTGNDCEEGQDCSTSTPIPEPDKCVGDKCSSHTNQYCISTGGRVILTPQGGTGGAKTMVCLTPIKWYEKLR